MRRTKTFFKCKLFWFLRFFFTILAFFALFPSCLQVRIVFFFDWEWHSRDFGLSFFLLHKTSVTSFKERNKKNGYMDMSMALNFYANFMDLSVWTKRKKFAFLSETNCGVHRMWRDFLSQKNCNKQNKFSNISASARDETIGVLRENEKNHKMNLHSRI